MLQHKMGFQGRRRQKSERIAVISAQNIPLFRRIVKKTGIIHLLSWTAVFPIIDSRKLTFLLVAVTST